MCGKENSLTAVQSPAVSLPSITKTNSPCLARSSSISLLLLDTNEDVPVEGSHETYNVIGAIFEIEKYVIAQRGYEESYIELVSMKKGDSFSLDMTSAPKLEVIPDSVDDEGLLEAYLDADRHKWKKAELIAYDNASIAEQDEKGKITAAEKKGAAKKEIEGGSNYKRLIINI